MLCVPQCPSLCVRTIQIVSYDMKVCYIRDFAIGIYYLFRQWCAVYQHQNSQKICNLYCHQKTYYVKISLLLLAYFTSYLSIIINNKYTMQPKQFSRPTLMYFNLRLSAIRYISVERRRAVVLSQSSDYCGQSFVGVSLQKLTLDL